jgi:FkbM family methyltransferase
MRCYPDGEAAAVTVYYNGGRYYFDPHGMGFIKHYLKPGDAFLDVGANIGIYTLFAASIMGQSVSIDSFEAHPRTAMLLEENVTLNGLQNSIRIHRVAAGAAPGVVRFASKKIFGGENNVIIDNDEERAIEVPCVRIDDLLGNRTYAMGKMDIEGFELMALQGAINHIIAANPPVWYIEVTELTERYGYTQSDLGQWLTEMDYELAIYDVFQHELHFMKAPWQQRKNILALAKVAKQDILARLGADLKIITH